MRRLVLYVAHPLAPTPEQIASLYEEPAHGPRAVAAMRAHAVKAGLDANIASALRWLAWLRKSFPEVTFIAPWITAVLAGEDDTDPAQREAGLVDACEVVKRCDGLVLCGDRVSTGMSRECAVSRRWWNLTGPGPAGIDVARGIVTRPLDDDNRRVPFVEWAAFAADGHVSLIQ